MKDWNKFKHTIMNKVIDELDKLSLKELLEIHVELKKEIIEKDSLLRKICSKIYKVNVENTNVQMFMSIAINLEYIFGEILKNSVSFINKIG